jgi:hypothetical protein
MKNIVGIAVSFALVFVIMQGAVSAATDSKTKVYIENADDDDLWIKFYLDGKYIGSTIVSQNTTKYFAAFRLSGGPHELKIEWKDPDTCEWQEKTKTVDATGEDMTVTISVVPDSTSVCEKFKPAQKTSYGSLAIYVKNNDDDTLFVILSVNGTRKKETTVARYSTYQLLNIYSMRPGSYTVVILWREPDTGAWYEKTQEVTVAEGRNYVTLEIDEMLSAHDAMKPNSATDVYIKNIDDDDLWVDVFVDSISRIKYVESGKRRYVGRYDKLYPGKHTVRLRWMDPDIKGWQESRFVVYLTQSEVASMTFDTVKNTYVRRY